MNLVKSVVIHAVIFGASALLSAACWSVEYGNPAFKCKPSKQGSACPEGYQCCSDDPAAQDGGLPAYPGSSYAGAAPIFSDNNNVLSQSGMCIQSGSIPPEATTLQNGCPIPCNPTWAAADIATVCGGMANCCQTQPLDVALDCVLDPIDGRYRAVRGTDIGQALTRPDGSIVMVNWATGSHTTIQDPDGVGCRTFTADPVAASETNLRCYDQLTAADQRGFCDSRACTCFEDECDMLNPDWVPRCPAA
ncbi:MAG: hypothetical protein H6713_28475 [Myxococcales bacterium]|nr:hypothetical protein [Myxococcales bacterium]MCB9753897.1 hypothetical protein [Myxococcales bacterium]